jgi:hypothetical protein
MRTASIIRAVNVCCDFDVVAGLAWSEDPESYARGSIDIDRGSHAGQVEDDDPGWGLGVGLTTPPCKTWICLETSAEASEDEDGWGDHGPKTGRNAIEEEKEDDVCCDLNCM